MVAGSPTKPDQLPGPSCGSAKPFTGWLLPEQGTNTHTAVGGHCSWLPTPQWEGLAHFSRGA